MSSAEDYEWQPKAETSALEGATATVEKAPAAPAAPDDDRAVSPPEPPADSGPKPFPLADAGEYYIGLWSDRVPMWGCPYCTFTTSEGSNTIAWHIFDKADQGNKRHVPALETK